VERETPSANINDLTSPSGTSYAESSSGNSGVALQHKVEAILRVELMPRTHIPAFRAVDRSQIRRSDVPPRGPVKSSILMIPSFGFCQIDVSTLLAPAGSPPRSQWRGRWPKLQILALQLGGLGTRGTVWQYLGEMMLCCSPFPCWDAQISNTCPA